MGDFGGHSYDAGPVVEEERTWAMVAHLSVMAGSVIPLGNIAGPFVVWLIQKDRSLFVAKHAMEAVMFQAGVMLASIGLAFLVVATFGTAMIVAVPAILGMFVASIVYMVLGAVRANEGKVWEYPVTTRFVS